MQCYAKSLFIFRRDLRLIDNTALNAALRQSQQVLVCFIFDPRQIEPHSYQSLPALQFMLQSLEDLQQQIAKQGGVLYLFKGNPAQIINQLQSQQGIQSVFVNRDYTPFSRQRDSEIQQQCLQLKLDFHSHGDALLNEPEQVLKQDATPYQVFTAYYHRARQIPVRQPQPLATGKIENSFLAGMEIISIESLKLQNAYALHGGRSAATKILANINPTCRNYLEQRDLPALEATCHLSAYLKFGCCSIREAYYAVVQGLGNEHALLRQFYWRDFFTHIAWHYPHVFGHAFHRRYDGIQWQNNPDWFWAWANGHTGFPLVDAAMRELNATGWMHNRLRMVVASFLVKDLHVSWRWGERYFAQHLLDYDPCVNNGNWQWTASTGCDAQPYFRVFNPWLQQRKFDADCEYIKRWLPELRVFSAKIIHQWQDKPQAADYPSPMVDHALQSRDIKALYQAAIH